MRRLLMALVLVLAGSVGWGQEPGFIRYTPPSGSAGFTFTTPLAAPAADNCSAIPYSFTSDTNTGTCTPAADTLAFYTGGSNRLQANSTAVTSTVPVLVPNGTLAAPGLALSSDADGSGTGFYRTAANSLGFSSNGALRATLSNSGLAISSGSIAIDSTGTVWAASVVSPAVYYDAPKSGGTHYFRVGTGYANVLTADVNAVTVDVGVVLGSKSKALADATATAFARVAVADDDYEGCAFGWTAYAEDAGTDARQVRKGRTNVAILNNGGTEACNFSASADDEAVLVTAGTFTCTFDCAAGTNTVDLRANCDTSLDAAAETLTFEYRLDCESTTTVTPQ